MKSIFILVLFTIVLYEINCALSNSYEYMNIQQPAKNKKYKSFHYYQLPNAFGTQIIPIIFDFLTEKYPNEFYIHDHDSKHVIIYSPYNFNIGSVINVCDWYINRWYHTKSIIKNRDYLFSKQYSSKFNEWIKTKQIGNIGYASAVFAMRYSHNHLYTGTSCEHASIEMNSSRCDLDSKIAKFWSYTKDNSKLSNLYMHYWIRTEYFIEDLFASLKFYSSYRLNGPLNLNLIKEIIDSSIQANQQQLIIDNPYQRIGLRCEDYFDNKNSITYRLVRNIDPKLFQLTGCCIGTKKDNNSLINNNLSKQIYYSNLHTIDRNNMSLITSFYYNEQPIKTTPIKLKSYHYYHLSKTGGTVTGNIIVNLNKHFPNEFYFHRDNTEHVIIYSKYNYNVGSIRNICDWYLSYWQFFLSDSSARICNSTSIESKEVIFSKCADLFYDWINENTFNGYGHASAMFAMRYSYYPQGVCKSARIDHLGVTIPEGCYLDRVLDDFWKYASHKAHKLFDLYMNYWIRTELFYDDLLASIEYYSYNRYNGPLDMKKIKNIIDETIVNFNKGIVHIGKNINNKNPNRHKMFQCEDFFNNNYTKIYKLIQIVDPKLLRLTGCCNPKKPQYQTNVSNQNHTTNNNINNNNFNFNIKNISNAIDLNNLLTENESLKLKEAINVLSSFFNFFQNSKKET